MKFYLGLLLATILTASIASNAEAILIVSVDMDPGTPGIQTTNATPLHVGDTITANLFLELTGNTSLALYNYSVEFGTALEYVSRTELPLAANYAEFDFHNTVTSNAALRFDGGTFGPAAAGPLGPNQIGSITLRVIGPGTANVTPGVTADPNFDFFIDDAGAVIAPSLLTFNGGTVNIAAVPEPSSMALLATAGIGTWMARRRVRRPIR